MRMALETAGTKKDLGVLLKEAAQGHTPEHSGRGRAPAPGDGSEAVAWRRDKDVTPPVRTSGPRSPKKCVQLGSGVWKTATGCSLRSRQGQRGQKSLARELVGTARGGGLAGFSQQAAVEGSGVKVRKPRFPMFFRAQK